MSRRKVLAAHDSRGRIKPSQTQLLSPAETRRLFDAAAAGLRDATWCTMAGRLHITGKLTSAQFSAAKRWCALVADYSVATQSPLPPRTPLLERANQHAADPHSAKGEKEGRLHEKATKAFLDGRHALRMVGADAERVVESIVVRDQAPAGFNELNALRAGLQALSALWSVRRKR